MPLSKLKDTKNTFNTSTWYTFKEPNFCTFCEHTMTPEKRTMYAVPNSDLIVLSFTCSNASCKKILLGIYEKDEDNKSTFNFKTLYPNISLETLPDHINKHFPRFVKSYGQANTAEQLGHYELAGAGYRNALEILIKDYAIKILKEDAETVSSKRLYDAIDKYLPNSGFKVSADMVRILGNDNTHYERNYLDIDFSVLKAYMEIFIQMINTQLMIKYPLIQKANREQV